MPYMTCECITVLISNPVAEGKGIEYKCVRPQRFEHEADSKLHYPQVLTVY